MRQLGFPAKYVDQRIADLEEQVDNHIEVLIHNMETVFVYLYSAWQVNVTGQAIPMGGMQIVSRPYVKSATEIESVCNLIGISQERRKTILEGVSIMVAEALKVINK